MVYRKITFELGTSSGTDVDFDIVNNTVANKLDFQITAASAVDLEFFYSVDNGIIFTAKNATNLVDSVESATFTVTDALFSMEVTAQLIIRVRKASASSGLTCTVDAVLS